MGAWPVGEGDQFKGVSRYILMLYVIDEELELLPTVLLCLYQVTELNKYTTQGEGHFTDNTLPEALCRIFVSIAAYVKEHPAVSAKVCTDCIF